MEPIINIFFTFQQTPNPADFSLSDEEKSIPALKRIQIFLEKHDMRIEKEIEQIENFLSKDENNTLHCSVKRITESLTYLDEDEFNDQTLHGILEIMSINFQLFQEKLPFGSILRKLLRVCGLILSSVWQANKIENFMCSRTEPGFSYETSVAKDIRDLKRFASVLREIENADNILERNIAEMRREGKFCEELPCLASLKENAKSQSSIMLTSVKVSILQLLFYGKCMLFQDYLATAIARPIICRGLFCLKGIMTSNFMRTMCFQSHRMKCH